MSWEDTCRAAKAVFGSSFPLIATHCFAFGAGITGGFFIGLNHNRVELCKLKERMKTKDDDIKQLNDAILNINARLAKAKIPVV